MGYRYGNIRVLLVFSFLLIELKIGNIERYFYKCKEKVI